MKFTVSKVSFAKVYCILYTEENFYIDSFFFQIEHPKVVIIDVETQAGTYIKELIHGDFGRTKPSISTILGQKVDILSLDVLKIDLDFPK